ncbi:MAG: 50S ribosomal protein L22 [Leptolyngbya sp. PLA1]|nr:50S ribosomal protein L22 [Leptolyngbya sp. PLA1]
MVRQIAEALRTTPKDLVAFTSEVRHHRGSPRKARLVTDMIRGKNVDQALNLLTFTTKRAAVNVKKCLNAAIADAEQSECDITRLFVAESRVDNASVIKRFQPKDRGRAHPILKPLSHITISVEERAAKA